MNKLAACLCSALLVAASAVAQDAGNTQVNELVKHWTNSKELSLAVAEAMPADDYAFKATPAEMTFGGQLNHIAAANVNYCSAALGTEKPKLDTKDESKAAAVKNLTAAYDYCINGLSSLKDSDLQAMALRNGNSVSKFELFWGGFTHAAHHRGQAEVYLRLKGVTPPQYKF